MKDDCGAAATTPHDSNDLLHLSATRIAALIRRRDVSPVEVVKTHIERARYVNGKINAIAHERFSAAIDEAHKAEQQLMRGAPLGALHGVPCTVKEGLGFGGLPKTAGSTLRRTHRAACDATVVTRIRNAGGIVIALTNQSEMALWPAADNLVYGRTENPWRAGRTAGGSSGGEAALVAAGGSVFGIGTDGGGSIRIPAAYCGVFGHKPSSGLAPLTGHVPLDERFETWPGAQAMARYFSPGPITRRAEDLMLMLRVIAGPDDVDRNVRVCSMHEPSLKRLDGLRVLVCDSPSPSWFRSVKGAGSAMVRRAASALESLGASIVPWTDPLLTRAFEIWVATIASTRGPTMQTMIGQGRPPSLVCEMAYLFAGEPRHTLAAWLTCASERWLMPCPSKQRQLQRDGAILLRRLRHAMGPNGILLLPPVRGEAPGHHHPMLYPRDIGLCALFNALELPATVAPVSQGEHGLPLSVQIVGPHGGDHLTLSAALGIEQTLGAWRMPNV